MARTYELGIVFDPRQSDEAVQETVEKFREMVVESGSTVTEVDYWGRRKLAYPIQKFTEGKYVFIFITSETGSPPFTEIERLLRQNDKVLRFLTVRTDEDLKRAARKGKPGTPGGPIKPPSPEEIAAAEQAAAAAEQAESTPAETAEPADAAKPTEAAESADADAAEPAEPVEATESADAAEPAEAAEPVAAEPADTAESAEAATDADADADESTSSAKEE